MRLKVRPSNVMAIDDCLLVVYCYESGMSDRNPNQNTYSFNSVDFFDRAGNLIWTAEDIGEEITGCYKEGDDVQLNTFNGAIYKVDMDTGKLEFIEVSRW